jgi:hypothetical protein
MTNAEKRVHEAVEKMATDERGAQHIGKSLVEYVRESGHQGWEMSDRDMRVVANFLEDLERYARFSA